MPRPDPDEEYRRDMRGSAWVVVLAFLLGLAVIILGALAVAHAA